MVVTFDDLMNKMAAEDAPDFVSDDEGMHWVFYFTDEKGKEREISQVNPSKAFFRDARAAKIEKGEKLKITRKGVGVETQYIFERFDSEGNAVPPQEKADMPF